MDTRNLRLTMHAKPKILMEVMPAAMVASLLVLTYLVFAAGCVLIVRHNLLGTSFLDVPGEGGGSCPGSSSISAGSNAPPAVGCTQFSSEYIAEVSSACLLTSLSSDYGATFKANFSGLSGLYGSVSLHATFENETVLNSLPDPAVVDVFLEACTERMEREFGECESGWEVVLCQVRFATYLARVCADFVQGGRGGETRRDDACKSSFL